MKLRIDATSLCEEANKIIETIKKEPVDDTHRMALANVRLLQGQYEKALQQMQVACLSNPEWVPQAQLVKMLIQCEATRQAVFEGKIQADLISPAPQWLEWMMYALKNEGTQADECYQLRARALMTAPEISGILNKEKPFFWFSDGDERLGPILEVYADARYFWLPIEQIESVELQPQGLALDLLWMKAWVFTPQAPTGKLQAYLPVRYARVPALHEDSTYETEWKKGQTPEGWQGKGVRVWYLDGEPTPMRNVSGLSFRSHK